MEYEDTSQNSLLGGDMNEDTQNEGSTELNISKTALHDPIASDQLPIDSLFQEVKCRLSANSSCNNMNYGENMLPAFATINHGQTLEVTDNKGEPDFDDNVTDNKREPDSDDDVTDNKGEPDADDNVTDNKGELDSDDSVTDNKGEPDSDDNVTDNKGELDSDDNVTDNKGEPDFGDNVTDNKGEPDSDDNVTDNNGEPDSDDNVTDNKGEPDSVDNVTDNKGEQDSNDNVTDNKGEQDSDDNVTDNKGGLDSDDNVTDDKGDPNSDDNVTDNKRELDSDDNFTDTCTKGEPDSDDNVQLLPAFDKIIEDNVDIELHENISDNLIHPTHTFDDLSNVLNAADQKTEICYGLCTCSDASVDSILPAFDKMKYNPEINHLSYNNEFDLDNDSNIDEPLSTGRSIEKCELGNRLSNGYSNCIKDDSLITSDAIDSHSIYDHSNLEQFKTNPVSECAFNTVDNLHSMTDTCTCNENIEMELVMEEMVEFPVPCDKILQENHAGETEIGATDCERLSVIPQNVIEKQSKIEDLKFECDVTQTVNFSDDTNLVETEVDNNRDGKLESEDPADDMCMKGAGAAVCTSTQDMTDTESVTDEAAEYLSEKESCFVVLGTLLVIMCIELYSSSSKHIRARETDLLESSDDLGLNLLFEEGNEGRPSRNLRQYTSARSKTARKRKKQQQKLLPLAGAKKKTKHKFAENLEDLRPPWYHDEHSLTDVDHSLTCPICLEMYYLPCVCQPCAHIFCDPCLRRLTRGQGSEGILCPLCRTVIGSCSLDKEFNEQLMMSHPGIYYARHSAEKKSKYRHFLLPFTPPVPLSKRLLRHMVMNRTNLPLNQGTLYSCSKLLVGCLAGACISVLIMLFCHVRGIHSARDVNIMFLSFFTGAIVTIVVNKMMRL